MADSALVYALTVPLLGAVLIGLTGRRPNLRESVTVVTAVALFGIVLSLLGPVLRGERPELEVLEFIPGIELAFKVEPLGMIYALLASFLWIFNSIYSFGYMRATNESSQTRFYMCFAVALASVVGIAFAGNLFTLFVFYEVLTFSTYPLVTHKRTPEAVRSGRIYLGFLVGTSVCLLLLAVIWTGVLAGTLDFRPGGILAGHGSAFELGAVFTLFVLGTGKAAVMPFHFWLPRAMVAPTPVSALLHAVAVVKAGVFIVLKISVYVVGVDQIGSLELGTVLSYLAAGTILIASVAALAQDNLKARLAYSTISQLSYIVLGASLGVANGIVGGGMHIAMHGFAKITLFFCAGAIYVAAKKTKISELNGIGRAMPITMFAFFIAALGNIGLPPLGGAWSKWYLSLGTLDAGQQLFLVVYLLSSIMNVAYLLPIPVRAFFTPSVEEEWSGVKEAPLACLIPIIVTASGSVALFVAPDLVWRLASSVV
ncbi:MAG: monovalent cation/H+ antiporter subunit D family protein [Planctomycetota bacterium]